MLRSMITASNTMFELQKQIDNISHNLANTDTTGYKAKNTSFSELIRQQIEQVNEKNNEVAASRKTPPGLRLGVGAVMTDRLTHKQGSLKETGRDLDIALTSPYQYFQVNVDGEVQYTRDGAFYLTPAAGNANQMQLVTKEGHAVLDENGNPIRFNQRYKHIKVTIREVSPFRQTIKVKRHCVLTWESSGLSNLRLLRKKEAIFFLSAMN